MSTSLTRTKWPLGWTPSSNDNGDPNGLLRMHNLKLDDLGALTLQRGVVNVNQNQFEGFCHTVYSRFIGSTKFRFAALSTGSVYASSNNFVNSAVPISAGTGSGIKARFSSILGSVFISSGKTRAKFDGNSNYNWGLPTPNQQMNGVAVNQQIYDVSGTDGTGSYNNWTLIYGGDLINDSVFVGFNTDPTTFFGAVAVAYPQTMDFMAFPGGGVGLPTDTFSFQVTIGDTTNLQNIQVQFILGDSAAASDYYRFEWDANINQSDFTLGTDAISVLSCQRSDFTRFGTDTTVDWQQVTGVVVTFVFTGVSNFNQVQLLQWAGSTQGPISGQIDYVQQNVYDNGRYVAKGGCSPIMSQQINVLNGAVKVTPIINSDPQLVGNGGQIWVYRRGGILPTFLRIGVLDRHANTWTDATGTSVPWSSGSPQFTDVCPDSAAQVADIPANLNLTSVRDIPDEIVSIIEGAYFGKCVFVTFTNLYISDNLNPDAIDERFTIRVSGDNTEYNLWIELLAATTLMVATTKNLYEVTGTLEVFADGTIDCTVRAMGEAHPPIAYEKALDAGSIYYMSNDGWRTTNGGASTLMSPQLNSIMRNETRYGTAPVLILPNGNAAYPVTVYKGQLITSNPLQDGSQQVFIYDILLQYWRFWNLDPICLHTEEDGTLIAGFGDPNDYYFRVLDTGHTINNIGAQTQGQEVDFLTVFDANQTPNNRKDAYTLRLQMNTGGAMVSVQIAGDNGGYLNLGNFGTDWANGGATEIYIDLFGPLTQVFGLGKRYSVRINGANLVTFVLNRMVIEYDPRPEQVSQMRILQTNLGSYARKRITNFAFVIDTLGIDTQFTPIVDGVLLTAYATTFNFSQKSTFILYFTGEIIGTDFGGIIKSLGTNGTDNPLTNGGDIGAFEFYDLALQEIVSEKLPTPVMFLIIPANDYGKPNRKRHSSYKFQINTRGNPVSFTPILDGVPFPTQIFTTATKQTVEYFFSSNFPLDPIAIDIGGELSGTISPFEFYGVIVPQEIEVLPPQLEIYRIPENNYGVAAKKRVRTMPMMINTNGHPVLFTPIVDQVSYTGTTFNTPSRQTVLHYFSTDIFGIDFSGILQSVVSDETKPFEFYGLEKPEEVEVLPVSKVFDQIGPVHLTRIGKVVGFRLRIITGEVSLPWILYGEDSIIAKGTLTTVPGIDTVYEQEWITKGRNAVVSRIEFGPSPNKVPFNRYYLDLKINIGGADSMIKLQRVGGNPSGGA